MSPSATDGGRLPAVAADRDGYQHRQCAGERVVTFNPSTGNTVTVALPSGTSDQYLQLSVTANSVQNGAQVSGLDVFGP